MLRFLTCIALAAACASRSALAQVRLPSPSRDSAAVAGDERDVLAAEHEWVRVTLKGDADAFASFLTDGYIALISAGRFVDKSSWTARIRAGTTRYQTVELRDLHVRFPTPDVAVVTGAFSQSGVAEGADNSHSGLYIDTWVRTAAGWRLASSGFVRPPKAAQ